MKHLYEVEYVVAYTSPKKRPVYCSGRVNVVANGSAETAVAKAKRLALGRYYREDDGPKRKWTCSKFRMTGVRQVCAIDELTD